MTPSENLPMSRFGGEFLTAGQSAFSSLQREIDRLFDDFHRGFGRVQAPATPRLDVSETDQHIEVTAELPGLEQSDVTVTLADNTLVIAGEKKMETEKKDKNVWLSERSYGAFSRSLPLPAGVTHADIEAKMAKGVLHVTVKKPAAATHQKIEVKAA
jgi:HSP20 family protein